MSVIDCITISPRLSYSIRMAGLLLEGIGRSLESVRSANAAGPDRYGLCAEQRLAFCHEALSAVYAILQDIPDIRAVPDRLPPAVPAIRTISAALRGHDAQSSRDLAGLASVLGSIIVDSAAITGAKFDYNRHNRDSQDILNQAKLAVDSKIHKQYPNVDTGRVDGV